MKNVAPWVWWFACRWSLWGTVKFYPYGLWTNPQVSHEYQQ